MNDLILLLPEIILYLVSGSIFIWVFNFIVSNQNPNDYQHIFIKSLLTGFVLTMGHKSIFTMNKPNPSVGTLLFLLACTGLAYATARLYGSTLFKKLCRKLKIKRTVNNYIWYDIEDKKQVLWIRAIRYDTEQEYLGQLASVEDFQRQPMIILSYYQQRSLDGEIIADNSNKPTERVLLDTSKFDVIEMTYHPDSENIK